MTTEHYHLTKVAQASKDWRLTDKQKIGASPEVKQAAISKHRISEQKLREAVDQFEKKVGDHP